MTQKLLTPNQLAQNLGVKPFTLLQYRMNDNSTIKGNMNLYTKNKVPSKLTINDFLKLHNINKENSTK